MTRKGLIPGSSDLELSAQTVSLPCNLNLDWFFDSLSATRFKKPAARYDFIDSRDKFKRRRKKELRRIEFKSL